jgi:hypothetical protein
MVKKSIPFIMPVELSITHKYGIRLTKCFIDFLDSKTILSGSFALASYLAQEGMSFDFEPNDIDVFVSARREGGVEKYIDVMNEFMSAFGYKMSEGVRSDCLICTPRVIIFHSPHMDTTVKIIVIDTDDIIHYIKTESGLSIAVTWWNYTTNHFETLDPYYTKRKQMYVINGSTDDKMIQKYIGRGFKIIKVPCPVILERDLRLELDSEKFDGVTVYNIFTLEDVSIREFLEEGREWNIVLKAGASVTAYGFDRGELIQFMSTKKVFVRSIQEEVYETPFNQCITAEAFTHLKYADYSIYELDAAYTETVNGVIKSLFNCRCYTVGQWAGGFTTAAKSLPVIRLIHEPLSSEFILEAEAATWRHAHIIVILNNIGPFLNSMIVLLSKWCLLLMCVCIVYVYTLGFGVAALNIYNRLDFWELIYIYIYVNSVTVGIVFMINSYRYH